ncbi:hypothetical protein EDD85DRAFT_848525 [Armillaria nabsnona]|nr:hypothetical protein EDD85DRAFT_848525 [Armillaria nabsnona]
MRKLKKWSPVSLICSLLRINVASQFLRKLLRVYRSRRQVSNPAVVDDAASEYLSFVYDCLLSTSVARLYGCYGSMFGSCKTVSSTALFVIPLLPSSWRQCLPSFC